MAIQNSKSIQSTLETLYQAVQNLCSHSFAPQVYANLKALTGTLFFLDFKNKFPFQTSLCASFYLFG